MMKGQQLRRLRNLLKPAAGSKESRDDFSPHYKIPMRLRPCSFREHLETDMK